MQNIGSMRAHALHVRHQTLTMSQRHAVFFLFLFWTHDGNTRKSSHLWGWCGNRLLLSNDYMLCKLCTVHERWIWSGCTRISTLWAILRVILFTYFHFDEVNIRWFEDCVYGFETEKCVRALSCNVILSRRQSQTGHTLYKNVVFYSVFICFFFFLFLLCVLGLCAGHMQYFYAWILVFICYLWFQRKKRFVHIAFFLSDDCYVGFFDLNSEFEEAKWRVKNE